MPNHYRAAVIGSTGRGDYGHDLDEYYRNLPFVGVVDLEKYEPPK